MRESTRDMRINEILDSAYDILSEGGLTAVTMTELTTRVGISRQMLYLYFHSADDVLDALYERTFERVIASTSPEPTATDDVRVVGELRIRWIMTMPDAFFDVLYSAYFSSGCAHRAQTSIRARINELLEINWIAPIVAGGVAANEARAAVHAMISTSLTTRELVNENAMSVDAATHLMIDVGSALMRRIGAEHLWVSRDEFSQAATA